MSAVLGSDLGRPQASPRELILAAPPVMALALFVGVDVFTARRIEIIDRYAAVDISFRLIKDLRAPHDREKFVALGMEPLGSTPAEFGAFIRSEIKRLGDVVRASGARVN